MILSIVLFLVSNNVLLPQNNEFHNRYYKYIWVFKYSHRKGTEYKANNGLEKFASIDEYFTNNKLVSNLSIKSKSDNISSRIDYEYYNKLIFHIKTTINVNGLDFTLKEESWSYVYDDRNNISEEIWKNNKGETVRHIKNIYDEDNKLVESIDIIKDNGNIIVTSGNETTNETKKDTVKREYIKIKYIYFEKIKINETESIRRVAEDYYSENEEVIYTRAYYYNAEGCLIRETEYDNAGEIRSKIEYEYFK